MNISLSCSLLKKKRTPQQIKPFRRHFQWNQLDPEYLLDPSESQVDDRAVFRLHWGVELEEEDDSDIQEMMKHVKDLHSKVNRYGYETATGAVFIFSKHLSPPLSPPPLLKFILNLSYQPNFLWYLNIRQHFIIFYCIVRDRQS
jgi:hypothetical protein